MTSIYTDHELEAMMADVESELVERKASLRRAPGTKDGPIERIRQAVCAFANDLPGHGRPGGPYGAVTAENFGQRWVADYRNPSLADAMRVLGIVQRFGMGISIARRELRYNGQPDPDFEIREVLVEGGDIENEGLDGLFDRVFRDRRRHRGAVDHDIPSESGHDHRVATYFT